jgi:hypothetical protein
VVTSEHRRHRGGPAGREREERRGEVRSEPAGSRERSERAASRRRAGARRRRRGAARCGPRAGQCPGGGAARGCSGVKAATAAVVEGRGSRRSEPGPRGRGAERRGAGCVPGRPPAAAPRARRAERRRAGPRAGPRRPEPARGTILQGVSAEGREKLGGAGVLARDRLTGLKNAGEGGGAWYEIAASVCCKSQQNQAGERAKGLDLYAVYTWCRE